MAADNNAREIHVKSIYRSVAGTGEYFMNWIFKENATGFLVYDADAPDVPYADISRTKDGIALVTVKNSEMSGDIESDSGVTLSSGKPCPFDQVYEKSVTKTEIKIMKKASGFDFAEYYNKFCSVTSYEEAIENGWINETNIKFIYKDRKIRAFTITEKFSGRVVLTQVWQDGAEFWIYESAENRESFRTR